MIKKAAVLLLAALLLILSACDYSPAANVGTLKCKVFKIGRADCIILRTASHTVVIDTGEEDDGAEIVSYLKEHKITAIDKLIITHYDSDHIGGAAALLDYAEVGEVLVPAYSKGSSTYRRFTAAMEAAGIQPTALTETLTFELDRAQYTVYPPERTSYPNNEDNEYSLIVGVTHGENRFLFAGDALTERLGEFTALGEGTYDFLKVSNHGDYFEGVEAFFRAVSPKYAAITCSDKNPADARTVSALEAVGAQVFLTRDGSVKVTSDGRTISVLQ